MGSSVKLLKTSVGQGTRRSPRCLKVSRMEGQMDGQRRKTSCADDTISWSSWCVNSFEVLATLSAKSATEFRIIIILLTGQL